MSIGVEMTDSWVSCDDGEIFVLTKTGYDLMKGELKALCKKGQPVKGLEHYVPELWYIEGRFEKVFENEISKN